jgi:hypothetical protein
MLLHRAVPILLACSWLSPSVPAQQEFSNATPPLLSSAVVHTQDPNASIVPITALKLRDLGIEGSFGTGFCLDPKCRFIGTNYHVAVMARLKRIKGQKVVHVYLASGPDDEGATMNDGISERPMKFTLSRDLAIFELHGPLTHHHGIPFSLDDLQIGQEVDIYAYPKESISPFRRLRQFHGSFKGETTTGLLAFDYSLAADQGIRPGASGGLVVDSKTQQIVGILEGIAKDGEPLALAVPVPSLADFVTKVQPCLAQSIFPPARGISPVSPDLYPKFVPPTTGKLQYRLEEPADVRMLRSKAQLLADSMRDFIAVQTFAWGSGNKEPVAKAAYEVRVLDGQQKFREYPDGKKELQDAPFPNLPTAINTGGEWSELPWMVGTELRLKIHQAADLIVNEQRVKVFQYQADPEDAVCRFKSILDFGFFAWNKIDTVGCYGEVWTDQDFNILRISENMELLGRWKNRRAVVTYDWLRRPDEVPRLIPLTIAAQAEFNKKVYWCRGRFMNYQVFSSRVKMEAN